MYSAAFVDRVLQYGEVTEAEEAGHGPVLCNGLVKLHIDGTQPQHCSCLHAYLGSKETLRFTSIEPGVADPVHTRELHMSASIWRCASGGTPADPAYVSELMALRQAPECCMQTMLCKEASEFTHIVQKPHNIELTRSELSVRNIMGQRLPHLAIEGRLVSGESVAYCCVYVGDEAEYLGIDSTVESPGADDGIIRSRIQTKSVNAKVWLLHAIVHGSGANAASAFDVAVRIFRAGAPAASSLAHARSAHSVRWAMLWNGGISIDSAAGLTEQQAETMRVLNIHIRSSEYALYSMMRDPNALLSSWGKAAVGAAPDCKAPLPNAAPALLALVPWIAWLQGPPRSTSLASCPMHMVSRLVLDAWSGYRVTLDRPRLDLYFQTLRHHIAEMAMRVDMAGPSNATGAEASTGIVQTLAGLDADEDAYTTGMVKRAFNAAEQICHALRIPPDPLWTNLRDKLAVARSSPFSTEIADVPSGSKDGIALLDPAALDTYAGVTDLGQISRLMTDNEDKLQAVGSGSLPNQPPEVVFAAIAALASDTRRLATYEQSCQRADDCLQMLMQQCGANMHGMWGAAGSGVDNDNKRLRNAAGLLSCVLFGFLGLRFQGYITRDGYHTVPATLVSGPSTAILPQPWFVVRRKVSGASGQKLERLTQNSRLPG